MTPRKHKIRAAFSAAAATYEAHGPVQELTADAFAHRLKALPVRGRALELGCGTGFFTRRMVDDRRPWVISDLSPEMLEVCRASLPPLSNLSFRVVDGESPDVEGPFGLICANLAVQWFEKPKVSLSRLADLLEPGGCLALTTFGADTYPDWSLPTRSAYEGCFPLGGELTLEEERFPIIYPTLRDFLTAVKRIGAGTRAAERPRLTTAQMRSRLEASPTPYPVTYQVFTALWIKQ